jgi:hypothetical protein
VSSYLVSETSSDEIACLSKRVQKYKLLFNWQGVFESFFKKILLFFPLLPTPVILQKTSVNRECKNTNFFLIDKGFWKVFLKNSTPFFLAPGTCYFSIK